MGVWFLYLGFSSWTTLNTAIPLTHSHGISDSFMYVSIYNWFFGYVPSIFLFICSDGYLFKPGTVGIKFFPFAAKFISHVLHNQDSRQLLLSKPKTLPLTGSVWFVTGKIVRVNLISMQIYNQFSLYSIRPQL